MHRATDELAALNRACWLAELTDAVSRAQTVAWRLGVAEGDSREARELYRRLETVRLELERLSLNGWAEGRREAGSDVLAKLFSQAQWLAAVGDS